MNRIAKIIVALGVWLMSSALLLFICVFSVNQTIIYSALIVAGVAFVGSAVAFALKCDKTGLVVAGIPAIVIVGLLILLFAVGSSEYRR